MLDNSKLGFFEQLKSYPHEFWVANTMEIFERLSVVRLVHRDGSVRHGTARDRRAGFLDGDARQPPGDCAVLPVPVARA